MEPGRSAKTIKNEDIKEMSTLLTKKSGNSISSDELKAKIQENEQKLEC